MVGPFIFLDHMGPAVMERGSGMDVRPHPHIALATVTYLFEGEIIHRDTLGTERAIHAGDVNWMLAGRGIAHSERSSPEERARGVRLHGIQSWVALPTAHEEDAPAFVHHPARTLPKLERDGAELTVIAGTAYGAESPVGVLSPTLYVEARLEAGARLDGRRGPSSAGGARRRTARCGLASGGIGPGVMAVLRPGAEVDRRGGGAGAADAARRRSARRRSAHLVELRVQLEGSASSERRTTGVTAGSGRCPGTRRSSSPCRSPERRGQRGRLNSITQLVSQLAPSREKACSQWARPSGRRSQMKRTRTARPPSTSSP